MFIDWLNNVRGGIFVEGRYRSASIRLIDDHSNTVKAEQGVRQLISDGVQLFLGPATDDLTRSVAAEVNRSGGTMVAPAGFDPVIFRGSPQVFGVESPVSRALPMTFSLLNATSDPPRSVAYFAQDYDTWTEMCSHVQDFAAMYGMSYLGGVTIGTGGTSQTVSQAVRWMKGQQPELIFGCTSGGAGGTCDQFLQEAQAQNLNAKALSVTMCIASNGIFSRLGDAARWVLGTIPWTSTMPFASAPPFAPWTASSFVTEYNKLYLEDPPQQAAAAWASCCLLVAAIEKANSTDPTLVAAQLRSMALPTIYGNISFDQDGQSELDWTAIQIHQLDTAPLRIAPYSEAPLIYPTPPWADRSCNHNDIPESMYGYNANGVCGLCPEVASFNTSFQQRLCQTCKVNQTLMMDSEQNTSYCQEPCAPGHAGKDCAPCQPGYFGANLVCTKCEVGQYSFKTGSVDCTDCPEGTYSTQMGSSVCSLCSPGSSMSSNGSLLCTTCDFGKNASQIGMSECVLCKPGWVARTEGMSHCEPCSKGTRSLWGAQECKPCDIETYQPSAGNDTCLADARGQFSETVGTVIPENDFGYWARGGGEMEFCKFNPGACEKNKQCAVGHTGRQCLTCLPGYARSKSSCFACPHRVLNTLMTIIVMVLAIIGGLLGARFVISSVGRAQDTIVIVLCKQLLTHCVTMSVLYSVLMNLLRERAHYLSETDIWVAQLLAAPLNLFDGCIPSETIAFSVTCLLQPFADPEQVQRLQDVKHTEFYNASLAADRDYLKTSQMQTETMYTVFWLCWPVCFILICNLIGFSMLYTKIRRNKEFYSNAFQFYKEVKEQGFKKVEKKYMERRRREYIDAYFSRINGIWSPVDHVLRIHGARNMHGQLSSHVSLQLYQEESGILKTIVIFFCFAPVGRALIRPILCMKLGDGSTGDVETLIYSSSAVTCSADHPVLWVSTLCAFIWFVLVPARMYYKLWKVHDRLHLPELMREFGFTTCGYKFDYWWWDPVVYIRKALCFVMEAMPFVTEKERIMGFLVLAICFFVLQFSLCPYDDRCNGLFNNLSLQHLALFVFATLVLQLLDELLISKASYTAPLAIALSGVLALMHVIYMGMIIYDILVNTLDMLVALIENHRYKDKPFVKKLMKYLVSANQARLRDSPYVSYDPLYGWITICGSHGDSAVPPYIPKGMAVRDRKDNRPKLSEAPNTPENENEERPENDVEVANCWQRMEMQRILSMSLNHIAAAHESGPVFSLSIIEFVVRVAFVLCKGNKSLMDGPSGPEEVDRHVWAKALVQSDALMLKEGGRDQGELDMDDNREERAMITRALLMEEELQKAFSAARGASSDESAAAADGAAGRRRRSLGSQDESGEVVLNKDEEEKVMRIRQERYEALVHDMFSPSTFRRGLTLNQLQFALMQLQILPRNDLIFFMDLFEDKWLHEKATSHNDLRRMAGLMADASEESLITSSKPKKSALPEDLIACETAVQATPLLRSVSMMSKELSISKDSEPDPSMPIALRWLFLVMELQNTVSLSSLRKTMRPVERRRDKLEEELKQLQEETEKENLRLLELQGKKPQSLSLPPPKTSKGRENTDGSSLGENTPRYQSGADSLA